MFNKRQKTGHYSNQAHKKWTEKQEAQEVTTEL